MLVPVVIGLGMLIGGCGRAAVRPSTARRLALTVAADKTVAVSARRLSVQILAPDGSRLLSHDFGVRVRVRGFRLASGPGRPGGELQFVLDDGRFDEPGYSADGRLALEQAVNGFYSPAYAPEMSYRRIPAGAHVLVVRLASNVGRALGVTATVHFRVR